MSTRDLRELASAADMSGPFELSIVWTSEYGTGYGLETPEHYLPVICGIEEDAEFIAAANPQRVLALLDRVADLEAELDSTKTALSFSNESVEVMRRLVAERVAEVGTDSPIDTDPEPMTQERLAANLARAVKASGLTQAEVAERVEMDPTALSKALAGKRRVTSLELALIASATNADVLGLLEAEPLHGPSYRAGMDAKWPRLDAAEAEVARLRALVGDETPEPIKVKRRPRAAR